MEPLETDGLTHALWRGAEKKCWESITKQPKPQITGMHRELARARRARTPNGNESACSWLIAMGLLCKSAPVHKCTSNS